MNVIIFALLLGVAISDRLTGYYWKDRIVDNFDEIDHVREFQNWAKTFDKHYATLQEESDRFLIFLDHWKQANEWNIQRTHNWTKGLNQFSDLTLDEFKEEISCADTLGDRITFTAERYETDNNPTSIDWTNHNGKDYVTPVKNQGSCGSCWAFSTTGVLESRYAIKHSVTGSSIPSLSEQQIVDCDTGDGGCNGGWPSRAYKYIQSAGGLCTESEYPYRGRDGSCKASSCGKKYDSITGSTSVTPDSATSMETAVASGPVSICIDAGGTFSSYTGGIVDGGCGTSVDHCVLVVGYGSTPQKYWRVKNSWGTSWGVSGYIKLCKECGQNGSEGECALLSSPTYPHPN